MTSLDAKLTSDSSPYRLIHPVSSQARHHARQQSPLPVRGDDLGISFHPHKGLGQCSLGDLQNPIRIE